MKELFYQRYVSSGQAGYSGATGEGSPYFDFLYESFFSVLDKGINILDIGCGRGEQLLYLNKKGFTNLKGVDVSREQVELAPKINGIQISEGDLISYARQVEPGFFDVIIAKDIFEHLSLEELFDLGQELKRILKKGGTIVGHVPNSDGIFGMKIRYGDLTHVQAFNEKSLKQLFRTLGFDHIKAIEDKPRSANLIKKFARHMLWQLFTFQFRLLNYVESGEWRIILSSNLTFFVS
jgi:SAM-dependent methyltransferase